MEKAEVSGSTSLVEIIRSKFALTWNDIDLSTSLVEIIRSKFKISTFYARNLQV